MKTRSEERPEHRTLAVILSGQFASLALLFTITVQCFSTGLQCGTHFAHIGTKKSAHIAVLGRRVTDRLLSEAIDARSGRLHGNDLPEWR